MKNYKKEIKESNIFFSVKTNYEKYWSQRWVPGKYKKVSINYGYVRAIIEMIVVIRQNLNYGER